MRTTEERTSVTIQLRADANQCALLDRAATARGTSRSKFMLESACREAELVLLDQRLFQMDEATYNRFLAELDRPPAENLRLRSLLHTKAPWE